MGYFHFLCVQSINLVKLSNAIFIDRKNHKKAIESTTQAVADMKKHNVCSLDGWLEQIGTDNYLLGHY